MSAISRVMHRAKCASCTLSFIDQLMMESLASELCILCIVHRLDALPDQIPHREASRQPSVGYSQARRQRPSVGPSGPWNMVAILSVHLSDEFDGAPQVSGNSYFRHLFRALTGLRWYVRSPSFSQSSRTVSTFDTNAPPVPLLSGSYRYETL